MSVSVGGSLHTAPLPVGNSATDCGAALILPRTLSALAVQPCTQCGGAAEVLWGCVYCITCGYSARRR